MKLITACRMAANLQYRGVFVPDESPFDLSPALAQVYYPYSMRDGHKL